MRSLFISLILLSFTIMSFGQNQAAITYTLQGQLRDSINSETIPYANVSIYAEGKTDKPLKMEVSDSNGKFSITINTPGSYVLSFEYVGKKPVDIPFTAENSEKRDLGVVYMEDNGVLDEVVVTSITPLVKVDLDKITYNMEEDPESKTNNVLEMLKKVPMVTVDGEENIQLKGSSNYKIYLNGKPSNLISSNPKDVLRSMPANTIKNIEVITDPGARYDAEGVAGIINIVTVSQTQMGGYTVSLNAGGNSRGGIQGGTYFSIKYGKVGVTGNFNLYKYRQPKGSSHTMREDFTSETDKYLTRDGWNGSHGTGMYGYAELSYEIDTLNLLNISFNRYGGNQDSESEAIVQMLNSQRDITYKYDQESETEYKYGSTGIGADYQRTFSVKDRLFTASYQYNTSPNDMDSETKLNNITGYAPNPSKQFTDGSSDEHTVQLDFTTPIAEIHTIEAGMKYIRRINQSENGQTFFIDNQWIDMPSDNDEFEHLQDILAAYAGYNLRKGKWGFKAGARFEGTWLKAEFEKNNEMNFKADYTNLVPSAMVTYQLKPMQNIRVGYNMRISRPGIWYLNPYVNTTDSTNISYGNPELDAVKYHNFSLNYSYFNPKLNANFNLSYSFADNSIQSLSWIEDGTMHTSYYNIGENKTLNLSVYLNWRPHTNFNLYTNLSGSYTDIRSNRDEGMENDGFNGFFFGGAQYTLPWDMAINMNGHYSTPSVSLQGETSGFYSYNLSLSKSFLDKKLNIRFYASNPFTRRINYDSSQSTPSYQYESKQRIVARQVGIMVSFRFGEMKTQIKKAQRGISNDDVMSGGQGGEGQGQSEN